MKVASYIDKYGRKLDGKFSAYVRDFRPVTMIGSDYGQELLTNIWYLGQSLSSLRPPRDDELSQHWDGYLYAVRQVSWRGMVRTKIKEFDTQDDWHGTARVNLLQRPVWTTMNCNMCFVFGSGPNMSMAIESKGVFGGKRWRCFWYFGWPKCFWKEA